MNPQRSTPMARLMANPDFMRLWAVGGVANVMRWVEILVGAVFTWEATQSALAVSLVAVLRAMPMLLLGAVTGVLAEVLDRRRLLMAGQSLTAAGSLTICALAATGHLQVWHLAVSGLTGGLVWTMEMASRRRMVTEAAGMQDTIPAVALDSTTNNTTRMLGPLLGGLIYQQAGIATAYAMTGCGYILAVALMHGVRHAQVPTRLQPRRILLDVVDATRIVRRHPALLAVVLVTLAQNIFAFSYNAVLPALGTLNFQATPFQIGLLTAAEPTGALLMGVALALRRGVPLVALLMVGGSAGFMACLVLLPLMPWLWLAFGLLVLGGFGTALFTALQTALPVTQAPPEARSRVLGLVTTCIGFSPLGTLTMGALADAIGPGRAISLMASGGLLMMTATAAMLWRNRPARPGRHEAAGGNR
jgi:MFS family permease